MGFFSGLFGKRIFISFDYDHDRRYRYLLSALSKNPRSDLEFIDATPGEIQSMNVGRIKAVLTSKIRAATHTLVIVGAHANTPHRHRLRIGETNWQHWEVQQSINERNGLIAVKIERGYQAPPMLYGKKATWAQSFNVPAIIRAIDEAG